MGLRGPDAVALTDALFTNDMAALEIGQVRYGALCDEQGKMVMDGTVFRPGRRPLPLDHQLRLRSGLVSGRWLPTVGSTCRSKIAPRSCHTSRSRARPRARCSDPITEGADVGTLRYFRFVHEGVRVGGVPVLALAYRVLRGAGIRGATAPPTTRRSCGTPCSAPGNPTAFVRSASRRSRCCGSNPGLLFPDIDYFPHDTDPYEVRLDNVVEPDKPGDFVGRDAIRAIAAQGTPRLLTTLASTTTRCRSTAPR